MKILFIANNLAGGGAEKVLLTILNELTPPEYQIDLLVIKNLGVYLDSTPSHVNVKYMIDVNKQGNAPFPLAEKDLTDYFVKNIDSDYDVEIAFLEGPPHKLLAASPTKAKKISWVHTDLEHVHWTEKYYTSDQEEGESYRKVDKIVFVSNSALQEFQKRFKYSPENAVVITNPIPVRQVEKLSKEYLISKSRFTFCTVASLSQRKGHSRLLYSMSRLFDEGYIFDLNLIGTGDSLNTLKELAHILNIKDHVHFLGFTKNPYPYMRNADAMILPSVSEGFPLVLCEALALELPVIATACCGNTDVLQNGDFGFLVKNTEEGIYQGIKKVLDSPDFYAELKSKAIRGKQSVQYETKIQQIKSLLGGE